MTNHLCLLFSPLFPEASRLALDAGISSWSKVNEATFYTGLSEDQVIRTKCRLIADTLAYLLSYQKYQPGTKEGWWIRLRGVNKFNQPVGVGHALIVIKDNGKYFLLDAYIGCREFTCRQIDFQSFNQMIESLREKYDPEVWYQLTGCREEKIPDHVNVLMAKYTYQNDFDSILSRYSELEGSNPNIKYGHKKD